MADFLTSLAARTLGVAPVVQPVIASMYAPRGSSMTGAHQAVLEEQTIMEDASTLMDGQAAPGSIGGRNLRGVQELPVVASRSEFHQGHTNEDIPRSTFSGNHSKLQDPEDAPAHENALLAEKQSQSVPQRPSQSDLTAQSPQIPSHKMPISPAALVQDLYAISMQEQQPEKNSLQVSQQTLPAAGSQDASTNLHTRHPWEDSSSEIELRIQEAIVPTGEPSINDGAVDPRHQSVGVPLRMQPEAIAIQSSVESREIRSQKFTSPENSVSSRSDQRTKAQKLEESAPTPLPPPTVQVTIGRIEVRATPASEPSRPQTQPVPSPVMSLDQYLHQRSKGDH
jgi:hypothetical protein